MATKATHCRYCGDGGDLYKGAHRACKRANDRRDAPPKRMDCRDCNMVRKLNRVGRCRFCQVENKRRYKAAKTAEYRKRKRAENAIVTTADKHCICGCGVKIDSVRKIYASNECRKKMKPPKVKKVAMPRDWAKKEPHRPLIEPKVVEESAYQIIVLAHVVVTKLPPCGVSRWTLPEEIDPAKERVHREMMRWNTQSF